MIFSLCAGCSSLTPVPYSFYENDEDFAEIIFARSDSNDKLTVQLISYENSAFPEAENGTYWKPVLFPADFSFTLKVRVSHYYSGSSINVNNLLDAAVFADEVRNSLEGNYQIDISIDIPMLEKGNIYVLYLRAPSLHQYALVLYNRTERKNVCSWRLPERKDWEKVIN